MQVTTQIHAYNIKYKYKNITLTFRRLRVITDNTIILYTNTIIWYSNMTYIVVKSTFYTALLINSYIRKVASRLMPDQASRTVSDYYFL